MRLKALVIAAGLFLSLCAAPRVLAQDKDDKQATKTVKQTAKHDAAWYKAHRKHDAAWYRKHRKHDAAWYRKHRKAAKHDAAWYKKHPKKS